MTPSTLSADTKDALAREMPEAAHCRNALLAGLALYGARASAPIFVTRRNAVARLFRSLVAAQTDAGAPHIETHADKRLRRMPAFTIPVPPSVRAPMPKPVNKCDRLIELRAAFLACGSLAAGATGYHLEFVLADDAAADRLAWLLRAAGREGKQMCRKRRRVVYFKDFDTIMEVLTLIGAFAAVLRLEDVRALKETKNRIHRLVNTEAANLDRAAGAAAGHCRTIEFVASAYGLRRLSPALREIAELRLAHPDESLAELGRRCNPPIGKPTANSRLTAIARLAGRLRGEQGTSRAAR